MSGTFSVSKNLLVGVLALLVSDAAAGLAGRLARGLAFAAAAVLSAGAEVTGLESLNLFHDKISDLYHILGDSLKSGTLYSVHHRNFNIQPGNCQ